MYLFKSHGHFHASIWSIQIYMHICHEHEILSSHRKLRVLDNSIVVSFYFLRQKCGSAVPLCWASTVNTIKCLVNKSRLSSIKLKYFIIKHHLHAITQIYTTDLCRVHKSTNSHQTSQEQYNLLRKRNVHVDMVNRIYTKLSAHTTQYIAAYSVYEYIYIYRLYWTEATLRAVWMYGTYLTG